MFRRPIFSKRKSNGSRPNLTGNIAVTLVLSIITFVCTNLFANKHYWKEIFWPDVPVRYEQCRHVLGDGYVDWAHFLAIDHLHHFSLMRAAEGREPESMNLLGLIVVFPGGANLTGNIAVTLVL